MDIYPQHGLSLISTHGYIHGYIHIHGKPENSSSQWPM